MSCTRHGPSWADRRDGTCVVCAARLRAERKRDEAAAPRIDEQLKFRLNDEDVVVVKLSPNGARLLGIE